ncbi:MAG: SDR family oxidoreductase [Gemmataceae bacterium]|jgi:glucose 1-dehydrogenase|nr:SDR family oxidoreductase [Gemmataceae bacterium]
MADISAPSFVGKVALVTGASSGIGREVALMLAQSGADVAMNYWTMPEAAEATASEIRQLGRRALLLREDISNQHAVEQMVARVAQEWGGIHLFVSSAVYSDREPFHTANMEGFKRTLDVSLMGAYYTLRAVTKVMLAQKIQGSIVIVSSPHAKIAFPNCMAYNIAKAGLDSMARTAAMELLPHKIRVNIFYPGWTDTPGERKFFSEDVLQQAGKTTPAGRLATSEEMARGILFLLDERNVFANGTTLVMDGGLLDLPHWSKRGTGDF